MKKLIELHDKLKNHTYRQGNKPEYSKSYGKDLKELILQFYEVSKDVKGDFSFFFHEALSNCWHLTDSKNSYSKFYDDGLEMDKDIIMACELVVGDIHNYIKSGKVEKLHLYYTGSNHGGKGRKSTLVRVSKDKFEQQRPWL